MSIEYFGLLMYDIMRSKTKEKIELAEKQLLMLAPKNSSIRSIILTEEQFQSFKNRLLILLFILN